MTVPRAAMIGPAIAAADGRNWPAKKRAVAIFASWNPAFPAPASSRMRALTAALPSSQPPAAKPSMSA